MSRGARFAVAGFALGFAALFNWLALARFEHVHNRTFDLALYSRMAWGLARGDLSDPIAGSNFAAGHMSFVLFPLGWLGNWFSTVPLLLGVQSLALALAAWPIARFGARRFGTTGALVGALVWLLYPNLGHVATYEFHPGNLAIPALCFALDALDRQAPRALWIWATIVVLCRADFALITIMIGVLAWRQETTRQTGRALVLVSCAYFACSFFILRPMFSPAVTDQSLHFGKWGGSPLGIVTHLFTDPVKVIRHLIEPRRLLYPVMLLAPVAFLPLASRRWLLLLVPTLAINLISDFPTATRMYSHYLTPAMPALVVGALDGLKRLGDTFATRGWPWSMRWVDRLPVAAAALGSAISGGLPWSVDYDHRAFGADDFSLRAGRVLAHIPPDVSVQAPDPLLPHLALRQNVRRAPPPERGTEYTVLDISHRVRFAGREDLLRTTEEPDVRNWIARRDHGVIHVEQDMLLLRRGISPDQGLAAGYVVDRPSTAQPPTGLTSCLALIDAHKSGGELTLYFEARGPCPGDLGLRIDAGVDGRVDLLFGGVLSPKLLKRGDVVRSPHALAPVEAKYLASNGLRIGLIRSRGARPQPLDPEWVDVPVSPRPGPPSPPGPPDPPLPPGR